MLCALVQLFSSDLWRYCKWYSHLFLCQYQCCSVYHDDKYHHIYYTLFADIFKIYFVCGDWRLPFNYMSFLTPAGNSLEFLSMHSILECVMIIKLLKDLLVIVYLKLANIATLIFHRFYTENICAQLKRFNSGGNKCFLI